MSLQCQGSHSKTEMLPWLLEGLLRYPDEENKVGQLAAFSPNLNCMSTSTALL